MANDIQNIITIKGNQAEIDKMLKTVQVDSFGVGSIDFNKVLPIPNDLDIPEGSDTHQGIKLVKDFLEKIPKEDLSREGTFDEFMEYLKQYANGLTQEKQNLWNLGIAAVSNRHYYNAATWYDWTAKNWGTTSLGYKFDKNENQNELNFKTAWTAPKGIVRNLSKIHPDLEFQITWADEDFGQNCGVETYKNGEVISSMLPHTNIAAVDFAADIWQMSPAERGLVLNLSGNKYICSSVDEYSVVEIFGKPGLFANERLTEDDIPKGLYLYHLRYDDDNCEMQTLERKVTVNHAGSLVTAEEIDFGNQEYIELTDESDLSFLGVDSDFEHLLSGDIPTFDTLDEYINKDGGLTYD